MEKKRALIVVRTYPTPSQKGVEVSCTAAITDTGEWLRLFPVPYRLLDEDKRFAKYQWVDVIVEKAIKDRRPESHKLAPDGITIVGEVLPVKDGWIARRAIVDPMRSHSLCGVQALRDKHLFPTLALIKPRLIKKLIITDEDDPDWSSRQQAALRQGHLFQKGPAQELEKVPHKFSYRFMCEDLDCNGHELMCTDWEMGQAWRKWKRKYGVLWEAKFREKFEADLVRNSDLHFFVGTVHAHPDAWIIVGLYYPPLITAPEVDPQGVLF